MEYKFVSESRGEVLELSVNNLIALGWAPLGGVSVCVVHSAIENERKGHTEHETEWCYAQAMTRTPNELGGY